MSCPALAFPPHLEDAMKDKFYCPTLSRQVEKTECDSRVEDGSCAPGCEVRQHWLNYEEPEKEPEQEPEQETQARVCSSCKKEKPLTPEHFKKRRHYALTCLECEGEPWNKKWNKKSAKTQYAPDPDPAPDVPEAPRAEPGIDISQFHFIQNGSRRPTAPKVSINRHNIAFNAQVRRQFENVLQDCQTIDIGIKNGGNGLQILFVPRKDMTGQYRIQTGSKYKIHIALNKRGYEIGRGPWPVREVEGHLLAEVGG
jgi:hypothetical protein